MLPPNVKLLKRDYPIRDLIIEINKLPFVDTTSSCSGHLSKNPRPRATQIRENLYLHHGWLTFQTDDRYYIVPEFIQEIEREIKTYPFASFEQHVKGGLLAELKNAGFTLQIPKTFYQDEQLKEAENLSNKELQRFLKDFGRYSSHYFSISADGRDLPYDDSNQADARLNQFYELWRDLTDFCFKFRHRRDMQVLPS